MIELLGILLEFGPGATRLLMSVFNPKELEDLFVESFLKTLKTQNKKFPILGDLHAAIKKDGHDLLELFVDDDAEDDPAGFFNRFKTKEYRAQVASRIVDHYANKEEAANFLGVFELILNDCLLDYRASFINHIKEKDIPRLNLLLQMNQAEELFTLKKALQERQQEKPAPAQPEEETPGPWLTIKENQIKILAITASPENSKDLHYEHEQDILLDIFQPFKGDDVYLDMPDPVQSSLTEIQEHLQNGHHDVLLISAHGGLKDTGGGFLCLEGPQGEEQQVTGESLQAVLTPAPRIVILSACFSAAKATTLMPVAQVLFNSDIETVIGFNTTISEKAALDFNRGFFLALQEGYTVAESFSAGVLAITIGEQKRMREIPGWKTLHEDLVPQLLSHNGASARGNFSAHRILKPAAPQSHQFMGAKHLDRGFIGRRSHLRDLYRRIEARVGAVVLKGPGGIGKSTLTTRAAAHLRQKGYDFMVIQGATTTASILDIIAKKAQSLWVADALAVNDANTDAKEKLQWFLDNFLVPEPMVVIFDNFEDNQSVEQDGEFLDAGLKEFIWFFRDSLKGKRSVLLFSSRYAVPGMAEIINLAEFSLMEFRKKLINGKALKQLDHQGLLKLKEEIGGNPRAVELLDCIAFEEFGQGAFTWDGLTALLPELQERIIHKKDKDDPFAPLLLDRLLSYLEPVQWQVMYALSIYRLPVGKDALAAQGVDLQRKDRRKLEALSLVEWHKDKKTYYVHRLTAQYMVAQMTQADKTKHHLRAATYFEGILNEKGVHLLDNDIETRWHYIQAEEWNRAAQITFEIEDYLTLHGYPQMSFLLLEEIAVNEKKLSEENCAIVYGRLGILYWEFGDYDHALFQHRKAMEIFEKLGDIQNLSKSMHHIAIIYEEKGDYDVALSLQRKSIEIKEKLEDTHGVAMSLGQIGIIYQKKGNYAEALFQQRKVMEIFEELGDILNLSNSMHQIGMIYKEKGDYNEALSWYQKSLKKKKKIGDKKGEASSLAQMGVLYLDQNSFEEALKHFSLAFRIFNTLESPHAKMTQQYIARIHEKMPAEEFDAILKELGMVAQAEGVSEP